MPTLTIDDHTVDCRADARLLDAARAASIYIPTLCSHPDLPAGRGKQSVNVVYRGATRVRRGAVMLNAAKHPVRVNETLRFAQSDG